MIIYQTLRNTIRQTLVLLLFLTFPIFTVLSKSEVVINDQSDDFLIPPSQLEILEDPSGVIEFEEIVSGRHNQNFYPLSDYVNPKINSYFWVKCKIVNTSNEDKHWVLQAPLHADVLAVFIKTADGEVREYRTGQGYSFQTRPIGIRTFVFEIPQQRILPLEIYIHTLSKRHTEFTYVISNEKTYLEVHTKGHLFLGLIYGILILMSLYNLMLFLSIKDKIYLFYVFFTISSAFFLSWKDGLGFQFLWPKFPQLNEIHYNLGLFFLLISFLMYAIDFLELKKSYPKLYWFTYLLIFINFIYCLYSINDDSYFDPFPVIYMLTYFYLFGIAVFYLTKSYKPSRYLIVSLVCILTALITIKLRYMSLLNWNWFIEYILNYAIAIEAITMSLATRDKITYLRLQKEKARESQLIEEKLKAENDLISLKNQNLESELSYRNNELATLANNLTQKAEFLNRIKKDLEHINGDNPGNPSIKKLLKAIESEGDFDNSWEHFQLNFDKVHSNFLSRLRDKHPNLKPADLLLCAYVKMGKSNKEIASLLNITISGVEKKRNRVKEKLGLDTEVKLSDFILNYK
jgi:DNA-binding CsgD family transcriptional regulator